VNSLHPWLCALAAAPLAAQAFPHNKLEFSNWYLEDRQELFPNYLAAGGNVAGDGLFKVLPAELLERAGDHRISGYAVGLSIDDAYTGVFPVLVELPALQLHRTRIATSGGKSYETIDLTRPVGPRFDPIQIVLPADNAWVVEVAFDPNASDPKLRSLLSVPALVNGQRAGLATLLLARPGEKRAPATPGIVLQASFDERHLAPGRDSYSGSYDAARDVVRMYGQTGAPSATGELYAMLRFANPTLQLFASTAGGVANDPQQFETHLGPGAYATDLATRSGAGFLGLFAQAEQFHVATGPPTHRIWPLLVATSAAGPDTTLALGGADLRVRLGELGFADFLIAQGFGGPLQRYAAKGSVGFDQDQLGAYASPRWPIGPDPALVGIDLWIQGLITTDALVPVDATNAVRLTIR
jgi:hypothetical protein